MLGLLIAFWAVPTMSIGHMLFSIGMTTYILLGIYFEKRGLSLTFSSDYVDY
jgi:protein-S-isoprenylcysteine O-methyltransferase Ste14